MPVNAAAERFHTRTAVAKVIIAVDPNAAQNVIDAQGALTDYLTEHGERRSLADVGPDPVVTDGLREALTKAEAERDATGLVVVLTSRGQMAYYDAMNRGRQSDASLAQVNIDLARGAFERIETPDGEPLELTWDDVQQHATAAEFADVCNAAAALYTGGADPFGRRSATSARS